MIFFAAIAALSLNRSKHFSNDGLLFISAVLVIFNYCDSSPQVLSTLHTLKKTLEERAVDDFEHLRIR